MKKLRYNYGNYTIPESMYGGISVDIGCNNGSFLFNNINNFKKIYAYEPNIELFNLLTDEYKKYKNIKIFNNAILNVDNKRVSLVRHNHTEDDGSCAIYNEDREDLWSKNNLICEVSSISIETILNNIGGSIDYLKMDCECSEYDGLLNKNLNSISYIGIEIHNQLGSKKYTELFDHICLTHTPNIPCTYIQGMNQEYLFKNKSL